MSKVFVNTGLSFDGYIAPERMTMENLDKPECKNWGAKWCADALTRSVNLGSARAVRSSTSSTTEPNVPSGRLESLGAVAIFGSQAART
jgi:hypothetical protein